MSRAEAAGTRLGEAIAEIAELFYQENTKKNFYKGLISVLSKEAEHGN